MSRIASHRSSDDSEKLKISARFLSMELRIQNMTNRFLESHVAYSGSLTSRGTIEPFMNPNLDLPPRVIVTALDQGR
jgi:hypothetical protein